MLQSRRGIICRTVKYGESSVIAEIFSQDVGMRSYIISGVRSKNAKTKSSIMQVMNLVEFEAYDTKDVKKGLSRIKEIKYDVLYQSIPFEVIKGSIGLFLIEICRKAIRKSEQNQELFDFIRFKFIELDELKDGIAHFHICFLIELAAQLGFEIENNYSEKNIYFNVKEGFFSNMLEDHRYTLDKDASLYLSHYLNMQHLSSVPREFRKIILAKMVDFYRYHIDDFGELKSLSVLYSLYS